MRSAAQSEPSVVVLGSANLDLLVQSPRLPRPGETVAGESIERHAGGKGLNQAIAAARAGGRVSLVGSVGTDDAGQTLLDTLRQDGIDVSGVAACEEAPTGTAIVHVDHSAENMIVVVPAANGRLDAAAVERSTAEIAAADALLVQLETPVDGVRRALEIAGGAGVLTVLDPAPVPPDGLPDGLLRVDVLCPNETECEAILGRPVVDDASALAACEELTHRGVRMPVITRGASGATCRVDGVTHHVRPPQVDAVDTTAAGDALAGALAVLLAEGMEPVAAVRLACATGSLTTTRRGAAASIAGRADAKNLLDAADLSRPTAGR